MTLIADPCQPSPSNTLVLIVPSSMVESYFTHGFRISMSLFQNQQNRIIHYSIDDDLQSGSMFCSPVDGYYSTSYFFSADGSVIYRYQN